MSIFISASFKHPKLSMSTEIVVLQKYCYYKCSVALPHGAVGLSAMCDCGIS